MQYYNPNAPALMKNVILCSSISVNDSYIPAKEKLIRS